MELIKKIFSQKKTKVQCVGAIKYPERILIETWNQVKDGYWIVTDCITFISHNASNKEIGEVIFKHLNLSITGVPNPEKPSGFKEIQEKYKTSTGLKTLKSQMKDAKCVSIYKENGKIKFTPTINGGPIGKNKGYSHKPKEDLEMNDINDLNEIGRILNLAWHKCE